MMTWLDTRKGVSQSRTESSLHNTYDTQWNSIRVYFTDKYTDYPLFGVMYAHARAMYTRPPFPQEMRPGIEASIRMKKPLNSYKKLCWTEWYETWTFLAKSMPESLDLSLLILLCWSEYHLNKPHSRQPEWITIRVNTCMQVQYQATLLHTPWSVGNFVTAACHVVAKPTGK